jgi:hypothetical protein
MAGVIPRSQRLDPAGRTDNWLPLAGLSGGIMINSCRGLCARTPAPLRAAGLLPLTEVPG